MGWPLATFNAHGAFLKNTSTKRKSLLISLDVLLKLVCIWAVPNIFKQTASSRSMLCQSWRIFLNSRCQKRSCGLRLNSFFPHSYDGMGMPLMYRHSHRLDLLKLVCICAVPNNFTQVFSAGSNECKLTFGRENVWYHSRDGKPRISDTIENEQLPELFWKMKMADAKQPENRIAYACWPTNENSFATFLVDRNDYHCFNHDILEKPLQRFSHPDAIDAKISFWLIVYHHEECF